MKKINQKDFDRLEFLEKLRKVSVFNRAFSGLKVGEGLIVGKEEWTLKGAPKVMVYYVGKKLGVKIICKTLKDGSGWAVFRKK